MNTNTHITLPLRNYKSEKLPVHERLFAKSKAPHRKPLLFVDHSVVQDSIECTFNPTGMCVVVCCYSVYIYMCVCV